MSDTAREFSKMPTKMAVAFGARILSADRSSHLQCRTSQSVL